MLVWDREDVKLWAFFFFCRAAEVSQVFNPVRDSVFYTFSIFLSGNLPRTNPDRHRSISERWQRTPGHSPWWDPKSCLPALPTRQIWPKPKPRGILTLPDLNCSVSVNHWHFNNAQLFNWRQKKKKNQLPKVALLSFQSFCQISLIQFHFERNLD